MPKFRLNYRELFRRWSPFRFKPDIVPGVTMPAPTIGADNNNKIRLLSSNLSSKFSEIVASGHHSHSDPSIPPMPPTMSVQHPLDEGETFGLADYLAARQNIPADMAKVDRILTKPQVILEIGCGRCEVARQLAVQNPDWGIIATDKFAWDRATVACSHYQQMAHAWKNNRLEAQQIVPTNLVILRAEAEILRFLPDRSIDSVLLVNPEPLVGQATLAFLAEPEIYAKIKPGKRQIIVVPFSREMGVIACGGYEFDHAADWSMGLGFIMASAFKFRKINRFQWGVDLRGASPYSKNSTQTDVYIYGNRA